MNSHRFQDSGVVLFTNRQLLSVAVVFCVGQLVLMLPVLLDGQIPFNTDAWLIVVVANRVAANLSEFVGGAPAGVFMFPTESPLAFGEPMPLAAALYLAVKWILRTDYASLFGFVFLIQALSATGITKLANEAGAPRSASLLAGVIVIFNNFYLACIDDTIWVFSPLLGFTLLYWLRATKDAKPVLAVQAGALAALQIYLSTYIFALQMLLFVTIASCWLIRTRFDTRVFVWLTIFASTSIFLAAPEFFLLLYNKYQFQPLDPLKPLVVAQTTGLRLVDFLRALPENLIYPVLPYFDPPSNPWVGQRRYAFIGLLPFILVLAAAPRFWRQKVLVPAAFICLLFIVIAMGPRIYVFNYYTTSPLAFLYDSVPLFKFIRVPSRAYFIVIAVIAVLAALALGHLSSRIARKLKTKPAWVCVAVSVLYILENAPVPMRGYASGSFLDSVPDYSSIPLQEEHAVLQLPSSLGWDVKHADRDLHAFARELIYAYFQTESGIRTFNGVNGYLPISRLTLDKEIQSIPYAGYSRLVSRGLTHVVFHKKMILPEDNLQKTSLDSSRELEKIFENDDIVVYKISA